MGTNTEKPHAENRRRYGSADEHRPGSINGSGIGISSEHRLGSTQDRDSHRHSIGNGLRDRMRHFHRYRCDHCTGNGTGEQIRCKHCPRHRINHRTITHPSFFADQRDGNDHCASTGDSCGLGLRPGNKSRPWLRCSTSTCTDYGASTQRCVR
ncbi:hypothetical protein A2J04_11000 [Rhodococcus sp. EPR-279]|nr:hypothetical protein A2J04_11000 [Rhodococcus sp. EPR-279]